jgi:cell shape-determining protein MreC
MEITDKDNRIKELENENAILKEQLNKYLMKNKVYYENNTIYIL